MNIQIIQPAGLGDILFCLKIAKKFIAEGNIIYWPVIPQYNWIKDYISVPNLNWYSCPESCRVIDIQIAGRIFPQLPIMNAKYEIVGIDSNDWLNYMEFDRNINKENELYKSLVTPNTPYCLICNTFASPPGSIIRPIPNNPDMNTVHLTSVDGYNPFDWCRIIEEASELRLVDTCFTYFVEKLNVQAKKMYLYSRDGNFYTNHLWKKPWEYIK